MSLIDTSVLIDDLRAGRPRSGSISVVTLIEVLRGVPEGKRSEVKELLEEAFEVLQLSNPVVETYCRIHESLSKRGDSLPDADLLIASCAMAWDLTLLSRDANYKRLEDLGLRLASPEDQTG